MSKLYGRYARTRTAVRFLGIALFASCAAAEDGAALTLFHQMQRALGGTDKIAGIQDFEQTVHARTWTRDDRPSGEVTKRVRWIKPNYLRLDQIGPGDTFVLYFDGSSGWEILPDGRQADLVGGELAFAKKYLDDFTLNIWQADRMPGYQITSPGGDVVRISVNHDANEQIDLLLDPRTWLPVKMTSISLADSAHPAPSETQIRAWTAVGSIRFPKQVWILHNSVRLAEITNQRIKFNTGLQPDELAVKPAGLKPQMR